MAQNGPPEAPARWVVVVPLEDAALFEYLKSSFASVPDVRVVVERRRVRGAAEESADNPRGDRRATAGVVSNFGCAVIRRPSPVVHDPSSNGRTLLWPHLRVTDVLSWTEQSTR